MDTADINKLRCERFNLATEKFYDDGKATLSSEEQARVEQDVDYVYKYAKNIKEVNPLSPLLYREKHVQFLKRGLNSLSESYHCLDASRPWLCYWILHSLELLNETISDELKSNVAKFLEKCQSPDGGFGGGPYQAAHLAPTYAAVNSLCILDTQEAYQVINRKTLYEFLKKLKQDDGSYRMHLGGEIDIRGAYCALSAASLTNILSPELFKGTAEWIARCQTYEGGFGGVPGLEAHGGYSFCGFATLVLLGEEKLCNILSLLRWLVNKQMRFEGGFQGRTNKLVDGCYSFWQGGTFPLVHRYLSVTAGRALNMERWLFHQAALQEYLLLCCQNPSGGLVDKPGKYRDYYHTCYTLSGLSVAQHFIGGAARNNLVIGHPQNELSPTHPVYNIGLDAALNVKEYFSKLDVNG